jgi:hypothetical protein
VSGNHPHDHGWRDPHAAPGLASVLDIGGDVGAIIVRLPDDTPTGELTACHRGNPMAHFHTGVHRRQSDSTDAGTAWVAVFPEVAAGSYSLLADDGGEHTPFEVVGGQVTSLDLTRSMSLQHAGRG